METENSSACTDGLTIGISTATTFRKGATTSMVRSAGGGDARSSTVYHMNLPSGAVKVMEPCTVPPIWAFTTSSYVASPPLPERDRAGTKIEAGPDTCSKSESTRSSHGEPSLDTFVTRKESGLGVRASQSRTTWSSASGSSPVPFNM
eukprot:scaffold69933_cov25-Tisochrysis_lutea.AAC.9